MGAGGGGGGLPIPVKHIGQLDDCELPFKVGTSLWTTGSTFLLALGSDHWCVEYPELS